MGCCDHSAGLSGVCGSCLAGQARAPFGGRVFMGGGAPIVAPMRNQIVARTAPAGPTVPPFYAAESAQVQTAPSGAVGRFRSSGDLPGGVTAAQWAAMTPAQQQTLAVSSGFSSALQMAQAIYQAQASADAARYTADTNAATARYQQQQETERARLQANAGGGLTAPGGGSTMNTAAGGTASTMPTWQWVALGLLVAGGGYYVVRQTSRRR